MIKRWYIYTLIYNLQEVLGKCQGIFTEKIKDTYIIFTKQCKVHDKFEWTLLSTLKEMVLFTSHLMYYKFFPSPLHTK